VSTATSYRSTLPPARDTFARLVLAEFTKFRTVRGWVAGLIVGALLIVAMGFLSAAGSHRSCNGPSGPASGKACGSSAPTLGPDGEPVSDSFYFVHQQLDGDATLTARVTSLSEQVPSFSSTNGQSWQAGTVAWAKAGLIVKASTTQGSAYAAIMATATHGVRLQYDYTHDVAGSATTVSSAAPRWLRLTRAGNTLTGYESADGASWTKVGVAKLSGLASSVQVGLFVASPDDDVTTEEIVGTATTGGPSTATATFDDVSLQGTHPAGGWQGSMLGDQGGPAQGPATNFTTAGGTFTVTGSGDIAPLAASGGDNNTVGGSLIGAFVGLLAIVVLGALFITAEYRRGLIRTTLIASPRRGRVLIAKAIVVGSLTFVLGVVASAFTMWFVDQQRRNNGTYILPASSLTEIRVVVGTAAVLAIGAVFALAVGAVLRRSAWAVATAIALTVLPYILAVSSIGALQWLLRLTPAAGFAVQQTLHRYPQVNGVYIASAGYYPLPPWAGLAVLVGWTAVAVGAALFLLRKRDA
jgi:ABC-type transport system involved in multi-copper enzyme maturation permease subunit/regulation of enolase protein 1 (concanavalin A-like superfamily)